MAKKVSKEQEDYWWNDFCKRAMYTENLLEPYTIMVNNKTLHAKETDELYKQYLKEVKTKSKEN